MNQPTIVLCVGMHRSGTSLTASLLQSLGVALPGELISADAANRSGYFENRLIVDAQEQLLQDLGFWWPTERASRGMPSVVRHQPVYRAYVDWLTTHLGQLVAQADGSLLAIKDPRTSLLLPAWREAAQRLSCSLRLVVCLRDPRDVCWSLVWRDGPSVGMGWSRAQRLWLEHYRALLRDGAGLPAQVVHYERWLEPDQAVRQLRLLARFLGQPCGAEQELAALARVRPEFNHGGAPLLPAVHRSLQRLHQSLADPQTGLVQWARQAERSAAALERHRLRRAFQERCHLLWLRTPWGRQALGHAWDPATLKAQLGSTSLRQFQRCFPHREDLRPHPLISPAHLNQQRLQRGLPPLQTADDLFRHLLYPDLIPLDPHPWFDCRFVQQQTGQLGASGVHPVLSYLRTLSRLDCNQLHPLQVDCHPRVNVPWLIHLAGSECLMPEASVPAFVAGLHRGFVLSDPLAAFGDPAAGSEQLLAHERYWDTLRSTFALWPNVDLQGPLTWLDQQPGVVSVGLTPQLPAHGMICWSLPGHWEAVLLSALAGVQPGQFRCFDTPQALISRLHSRGALESAPLVSLTQPLLELLLAEPQRLPDGTTVLNLVWPRPDQQSPWLHRLAQARLILECRPAVRAYLQGLGLPAVWPEVPPSQAAVDKSPAIPTSGTSLLLSLAGGAAEAQLSAAAARLNPDRYEAMLRLDAQCQILGSPEQVLPWLDVQSQRHGPLFWLDPPAPGGDPKAHAVLAWARQRGIPLQLVDVQMAEASDWLLPLCR
jgi:hypothetical protein